MLWLMYGVGLFVTATAAGLIASAAHGALVFGLGLIAAACVVSLVRYVK